MQNKIQFNIRWHNFRYTNKIKAKQSEIYKLLKKDSTTKWDSSNVQYGNNSILYVTLLVQNLNFDHHSESLYYTDKKKVYKQRKKTGSSSFQRIVFFT